jgi:hypothetical protein
MFFSMAIAQILVPYCQLGQCYIQKEMLHCNVLLCNATSLLWQFLQHKSQRTCSFQLKTENCHITEASSTYLTLEGEGDTFGFIKRELSIANCTKAIS